MAPASSAAWSSVSNPCASGRCSSGFHSASLCCCSSLFQTPAPRGGVPLTMPGTGMVNAESKFQTPAPRGGVPLSSGPGTRPKPRSSFQTPAPRGGVPLEGARALTQAQSQVSNPCASGRCSSGVSRIHCGRSVYCFKPLRLGAVFLWRFCSIHSEAGGCFKPLRLGAVFLCG